MPYLIGIDVGGTNTDSVLLDPQTSKVIAWNKQQTSRNVSLGIQDSINELFKTADIAKDEILSVTIGTTHFINAIVERDSAKLDRVAVLRLCSEYSTGVPPFMDFPNDLAKMIHGYHAFIKGGFHVRGEEINSIDEGEIRSHLAKIKELGIKTIVVSGIFSPVFTKQEIQLQSLIHDFFEGEVDVVLSSEISNSIGLLERENLSILNASIKRFASNLIKTFQYAIKSISINSPVLLTQNDGTVLTISEGLKTPIKTFASGTTNSMRGAQFLHSSNGSSCIVIDVGGTTTDVGLLLSNGYPRKTSSFSYIGGVKTRLSMPQTESIGLGGGSIVRYKRGVTVGPESIGYEFEKSLINGGNVLTTTDIAVHQGKQVFTSNNKPVNFRGKFPEEIVPKVSAEINKMIEQIIDRMKTSPDDIPVLLVGGGSFILPDEIKGASEVHRPQYYQVANAIGAAIGKISAVSQAFGKMDEKDSILKSIELEARQKAIQNGADELSISVVDITVEELPYVDLLKFEVKVIADVNYAKLKVTQDEMKLLEPSTEEFTKAASHSQPKVKIDYVSYRPSIIKKEWIISQMDLEFLRIGTYILGCGGGGDPYPQYLIAKTLLKKGQQMKVIDLESTETKESISAGFVGSPTVANERIQGNEVITAYNLLNFEHEINTVVALEIGGGNGFQSLLLGAELDKRIIDADLMGRAYPMIWQISPVALSKDSFYSPCAFSDGNGNDIFIKRTKDNKAAENIVRAALSELGVYVGLVSLIKDVKKLVIPNSISLAWRIGRAVMISKQKSDVENLPKYIQESIAPTDSKLLFTGKIIGIEKKLMKGYVFGEVSIKNDADEVVKIPFQNENLLAKINDRIIASVPDLITVIDADSGEAVGTPDYKYGLVVHVMAISPCNHWTDTARGLEIGGPNAFGFDDVEYNPVGSYTKPVSVIEEFS